MNMRVPAASKAKVNGLRRPLAQIARLFPVYSGSLKNGLSEGMLPSLLILSILPSRFDGDCAWLPLAFSPTPA
jgi:hypothetical protein